jgi:NAD(P)H-hydrate epimerase
MQRLFMTEHGDLVSAVTAVEARQILTRITQAERPGPAELVESAARSVIPHVYKMLGRMAGNTSVLIMSGAGYTGAVGYALGRHLSNHGVSVTVVGTGGNYTEIPARQQKAYIDGESRYYYFSDAPSLQPEWFDNFGLVVDALVGGVVYGSLDAGVRECIAGLSGLADTQRGPGDPERPRVLALEIPSGVDPTTGVVDGPAVTADTTISFAVPRTGMTARQCGSIAVADVGISPAAFHREAAITYPCRFRGEFILPLRSFT